MATRKIIKWSALGLVVLVIAATVVGYFAIDSILRSRIEANATESLKLKTTLQSANLSLLHRTLALKNLAIESPQGFGADVMFNMSAGDTAVTYSELRGEPIKIDQVNITHPGLVIEFSPRVKKLNLQALAENLKSNPSDSSKEPVHLIIKNLSIKDAEVDIWPGMPGLMKVDDVVIKLPPIEVHDIGSGPGAQNGAAIKDVAMQVITAMAAKAADSDKLPESVRKILAVQSADLGKLLGDQFEQQVQGLSKTIQERIGGDVGKDVGNAVEGGLKDLTGSLNKKKPATKPGEGGQ